MDRRYEIYLGNEVLGQAWVNREGLYYRIRCACRLSGDTLCRISVRCGQLEESLGIPVPQDGEFRLETRIPVKKLGEGDLRFSVVPRHKPLDGFFVPLCPEEPFRYISRLKHAYLERVKGQIGIVIKEPDRRI